MEKLKLSLSPLDVLKYGVAIKDILIYALSPYNEILGDRKFSVANFSYNGDVAQDRKSEALPGF